MYKEVFKCSNQGSLGISPAWRKHFTDFQSAVKKASSLTKPLKISSIWTSLLQITDMTRLETGKKIQILDSFTIFAQLPELSIWKSYLQEGRSLQVWFSSNYKSFKMNSSAHEKMTTRDFFFQRGAPVSEATPCKFVNSSPYMSSSCSVLTLYSLNASTVCITPETRLTEEYHNLFCIKQKGKHSFALHWCWTERPTQIRYAFHRPKWDSSQAIVYSNHLAINITFYWFPVTGCTEKMERLHKASERACRGANQLHQSMYKHCL